MSKVKKQKEVQNLFAGIMVMPVKSMQGLMLLCKNKEKKITGMIDSIAALTANIIIVAAKLEVMDR